MKKLTTNDFIKISNDIHKNKYDYSLSNYINGRTKIIIICPEHGIFEQNPECHMNGSGCRLCVNNNLKLNKFIFIERSNKIHHNKYDYSLVKYVNIKNKVNIICSKHGIFEQTPSSHLSGSVCPKCSNNFSSGENFIKKAEKLHGNKYDYSSIDYKNSHTKIKIICKKHGVFEQIPNAHLNGAGCSICSKNKLTTEIFIKKSIETHGDEYDYSLVNYKNINTRLKIICKKHGVFEQIPSRHLSGGKCPTCDNKLNKFIIKSNEIHDCKYDYSLVYFINNKTKIRIICKEHGIFEQIPNNHLSGNGCPKCCGMNKTTEDFINESVKIHGDKYDYSLSNYIGAFNKIKIICKKHGIFEQTSSNHLSGRGCSICNNSKGEIKIREFLEKYKILFEKQKKFKNCKYKNKLSFDFYLPDHNMCIEYDGIQHYESIEFFGGTKSFNYIQIRDEIKNSYCNSNNIKLIRIRNMGQIESILKKELQLNG